jgi:hypothetical protein
MARYIKTVTTEFEQFNETEWNRVYLDCSDPDEWEAKASKLGVDRYHGYFIIPTKEGDMRIHDGDWIATGVNGEHWPVKDEIFKKTYKKLPVIPKYVADDLEHSKRAEYSITMFLDDCFGMINDIVTNKTWNWCDTYMERHPDSNDYHVVLARAWLDGYEVVEVEE